MFGPPKMGNSYDPCHNLPKINTHFAPENFALPPPERKQKDRLVCVASCQGF